MTKDLDYGIAGTEQAMRAHVEHLDVDISAALAVSSIYRAANAIRGHVTNEVLRPAGLSWTGWVVMWVVWIFDGLETRYAAEAASISKGTLTGVVKTLEGQGLITRTSNAGDRRLVELQLTAAGTELMTDLFPKFNEVESRVVSRLPAKQRKALAEQLRTVVSTLEEHTDPAIG